MVVILVIVDKKACKLMMNKFSVDNWRKFVINFHQYLFLHWTQAQTEVKLTKFKYKKRDKNVSQFRNKLKKKISMN